MLSLYNWGAFDLYGFHSTNNIIMWINFLAPLLVFAIQEEYERLPNQNQIVNFALNISLKSYGINRHIN